MNKRLAIVTNMTRVKSKIAFIQVTGAALLLFTATGCSVINSTFNSTPYPKPDQKWSYSSAEKIQNNEASDRDSKALTHWIPAPVTKLPDPPLTVNNEVIKQINLYMRGGGKCIKTSIDNRDPHYKFLTKIFRDEGIPLDLLNLAIVESHFNPNAVSNTGALGIWQFTRSTGRLYGLRVDSKVDQRRDPVLSTIAAARLLRDLYTKFSDWYLALAAYNAGTGAINNAMRKSGSDDFWTISRKGRISSQTKDFVPRFIAATLLVQSAEQYGYDDMYASLQTHLTKLAKNGMPTHVALSSLLPKLNKG